MSQTELALPNIYEVKESKGTVLFYCRSRLISTACPNGLSTSDRLDQLVTIRANYFRQA